MEGQFDHCTEDLFNVEIKLESKEKVLSNAEQDVGNLSRRILLVEDEVRIIMFTFLAARTAASPRFSSLPSPPPSPSPPLDGPPEGRPNITRGA